jgi:zinc protease
MRRTLGMILLCLSGTAFAAGNKVYSAKKTATGLELIAMEDHKVPLVTIVLASKAGAMTETPEINGLTHLWEHMFFKGNKELPNQEAFNKRIRQLGITYNGDTSAEKVRYYFTLPSAFLEEGIKFMADAISMPLLEEEELKRERQVVVDEYDRSAAQPGFDFNNLQRSYIYGKAEHLRNPLGLRPTILSATREHLFRIRDEVFVPSNSALLVAGDFQTAQLDALVKKYFSHWRDPKGWKPKIPEPFPPFPATQTFVMARPNVQNAMVSITLAGPKARSQPADSFAADVLINLLEHRSGKFYKKFIDSGLTYQAGLSYYTQSQAGEIDLYATTDAKKAQQVENLLMKEMSEWAKPDYFSKSQLED